MLTRAKQFAKALHQDTSGAMAVEKILLLALISVPIVIVVLLFRTQIVQWFNSQSATLNTDSGN